MKPICIKICSYYIKLLIFCLLLSGCKKFVEVDPPITSTTGETVWSTDASAIGVLNGLYAKMSASGLYTYEISSSSVPLGLSADELTLWNGASNQALIGYYQNTLVSRPGDERGTEFWYSLYSNINTCNSAIYNLDKNTILTPAIRKQLMGEAKFMRAYCYFYLVNLYGSVPLALIPDYKINASLYRSPKDTVYNQIINDLIDAKSLLSDNFLDGSLRATSGERVRPTKYAAGALLARTYLYTQNWEKAESESTEIINNSSLFDVANVSLDQVFKSNSREAIWQLQPVTTGQVTNTFESRIYVITSSGFSDDQPASLSNSLLASFEPGDQRFDKWVSSIDLGGSTFYFPYKYTVNIPDAPVTEQLTLFRLAEQYLIRAEARIHLNKVAEGISDLNVLRLRATDTAAPSANQLVPLTLTLSESQALSAVVHERQVELFTEQGQRWLDLKRMDLIDVVMEQEAPKKGSSWNTFQKLFPIPFSDIQKDHNITQNPGY